MKPPPPGRLYRFGPFEVDVDARKFRKHGLRMRLQTQPLRALSLLLENPGEVISREDLQQDLWPNQTPSDAEHSLNSAVNKIRQALGDRAANPRFLETVPRGGYRFIAAVEAKLRESVANPELREPAPNAELREPADNAAAPAPSPAPTLPTRSRRLWIAASCGALVLASAYWMMRLFSGE